MFCPRPHPHQLFAQPHQVNQHRSSLTGKLLALTFRIIRKAVLKGREKEWREREGGGRERERERGEGEREREREREERER